VTAEASLLGARAGSVEAMSRDAAPLEQNAESGVPMPVGIELLARLADLEDDWDGHGSPAPDDSTLGASLHVLHRFMAFTASPPSVGATADGGVQFEWHQGGWDIEVEVQPDGNTIAWGQEVDGPGSFYGPIDDCADDLTHTLSKISQFEVQA